MTEANKQGRLLMYDAWGFAPVSCWNCSIVLRLHHACDWSSWHRQTDTATDRQTQRQTDNVNVTNVLLSRWKTNSSDSHDAVCRPAVKQTPSCSVATATHGTLGKLLRLCHRPPANCTAHSNFTTSPNAIELTTVMSVRVNRCQKLQQKWACTENTAGGHGVSRFLTLWCPLLPYGYS